MKYDRKNPGLALIGKCNTEEKVMARLYNIQLYKEFTGLKHIPKNKEYWTLCNQQTNDPYSEINQLLTTGMIKPHQFYGVDLEQNLIDGNMKLFPKANWIAGDWASVITSEFVEFNPAMVYLDTHSAISKYTFLHLIAITMPLCQKGTVLIANGIFNNTRNRDMYSATALLTDLSKHHVNSIELNSWNLRDYIPYNGTGRQNMLGFAFYKHKDTC